MRGTPCGQRPHSGGTADSLLLPVHPRALPLPRSTHTGERQLQVKGTEQQYEGEGAVRRAGQPAGQAGDGGRQSCRRR